MPHLFVNRPRLHDLTRDREDLRAQFRWETVNAILYKLGGLVFIAGSVLFLSAVGRVHAGAWCFVLGSLLFVVGSVLFTVVSVPYLWSVQEPAFRTTLFAFLAWQYLVGSTLFFAGGVFNYWRAYLVMRRAVSAPRPRSRGSKGGGGIPRPMEGKPGAGSEETASIR